MAGAVAFTRDYAAFGGDVKPFEKTQDVTVVLSDWCHDNFVGLESIIRSKIAAEWLGLQSAGENELSLIFRMTDPDVFFDTQYVIVMRSEGEIWFGGDPFGTDLEITEGTAGGHRVLASTFDGEKVKWVYSQARARYVLHFEDPEKVARLTNKQKARLANKQKRAAGYVGT
jgi:hypothetical protein